MDGPFHFYNFIFFFFFFFSAPTIMVQINTYQSNEKKYLEYKFFFLGLKTNLACSKLSDCVKTRPSGDKSKMRADYTFYLQSESLEQHGTGYVQLGFHCILFLIQPT